MMDNLVIYETEGCFRLQTTLNVKIIVGVCGVVFVFLLLSFYFLKIHSHFLAVAFLVISVVTLSSLTLKKTLYIDNSSIVINQLFFKIILSEQRIPSPRVWFSVEKYEEGEGGVPVYYYYVCAFDNIKFKNYKIIRFSNEREAIELHKKIEAFVENLNYGERQGTQAKK